MPPIGYEACAPGSRVYLRRVATAGLPLWTNGKRSKPQPHVAICVTQRYDVSPARVFDAWLDAKIAGKWLFATASQPMAHVEIEGRVGGSFRFIDRQAGVPIEYLGQYVDIVPDRRLAFTLSMEPLPDVITRVTVAMAPRAEGCALKLVHENVPRGHAGYVEGRWTGILYGLGVTLDSHPQRSTTMRSAP
jgi:uncharacterized protein YndB with AHSA1/START domain